MATGGKMLLILGKPIYKCQVVLLVGDVCLYYLGLIVALCLSPYTAYDPMAFLDFHRVNFLLMGLVYLAVNYIANLYDYQTDYRHWRHIAQVLAAVMAGTLANIVLFYFPLGVFVGRTLLLLQAPLFATCAALWRYAVSAVALPKFLQRKVLIVGAGASGRHILKALKNRPRSGMVVEGFIDDDPGKTGTAINGVPVLGNSSQLTELVSQRQVSLVVVAITHEKSEPLISTLSRVSWNGQRVMVLDMPNFYEYLAGKVPIDHISDVWLFFNGLNKSKLYNQIFKRLLDLAVAGTLLLITLPVSLVVALLVKLDSEGPIFYCQERLGYEGRPFRIIKFRTMVQNAESKGPQWASANDPRVTRVGWVLRKFRLDELPQLLNILKGEMSIVGPRPERESFIKDFQQLVPQFRRFRGDFDPPGTLMHCGFKEKVPYYSYRLLVKPGLTGWAQIMYPYASSLEQTKEKLQYDLFYVKNVGFFLDVAILLKTVRIVLFGATAPETIQRDFHVPARL